MAYGQHRDFNGEIINEAINHLYQREVAVSSPLVESPVELPSPRIYGIAFLKIPQDVSVKAKINEFDYISIYAEGSQFSPILDGIKELKLTTTGTSNEPIEILFIE